MLEKTERIMALDVGESVSEWRSVIRWELRPRIGVIERQNRTRDLDALRLLIDEHGSNLLLLGLPRNMNGTLGEKAREVQEFGELLAQELGMPVGTRMSV